MEPVKVQVTRWKCPTCVRSYANRKDAQAHGRRCWYDPANRACKTCKFLSRNFEGAEACAAGLMLPVVETRFGDLTPTLATDCPSHEELRYCEGDYADAAHSAA